MFFKEPHRLLIKCLNSVCVYIFVSVQEIQLCISDFLRPELQSLESSSLMANVLRGGWRVNEIYYCFLKLFLFETFTITFKRFTITFWNFLAKSLASNTASKLIKCPLGETSSAFEAPQAWNLLFQLHTVIEVLFLFKKKFFFLPPADTFCLGYTWSLVHAQIW